MAALCWTFIGSAILCYAYSAYVISCAIALTALRYHCMGASNIGYRTSWACYSL